MQLSEVLNKKGISVVLSGKAGWFEALRALALVHKHNLPLYVPGAVMPWLKNLLEECKIPYKSELKIEKDYRIVVKGAKKQVKKLKVDLEDDNLVIYLEPTGESIEIDPQMIQFVKAGKTPFIQFGYVSELTDYSEVYGVSGYGYIKDDHAISLADFDQDFLTSDALLPDCLKDLFMLDVYNHLVLGILSGDFRVDLGKIRELFSSAVLAKDTNFNIRALENWELDSNAIVGSLVVDSENFRPSMPLWADLAYLLYYGIDKPIVSLISTGDSVYLRVIGKDLPNFASKLNVFSTKNWAEGTLDKMSLKEAKEIVLSVLKEGESAKVESVSHTIVTEEKEIPVADKAATQAQAKADSEPTKSEEAKVEDSPDLDISELAEKIKKTLEL